VQADAGGVAGAAKDDGDLAGVQAFPAGQREDLAVGVGEAAEGDGHAFRAGRRLAVLRLRGELGAEPFAQRRPAVLAAALVGEHPAGNPVQPRAGGFPVGISSIRRQAARDVSAMTSAASSALPVRRSA
jgi:hypothetical protein